MNAASAELVAAADIILCHGYDAEELACECGFQSLRPNHAIHVALLLRAEAAL